MMVVHWLIVPWRILVNPEGEWGVVMENGYLRKGRDQPFLMDGDNTWWEHGPYEICQHGYDVCSCSLCQAICPYLVEQYIKHCSEDEGLVHRRILVNPGEG